MNLQKKKEPLSKENILKHVTEYDIIREFWPPGKELVLNRSISSPFRKDEVGSFIIGTKYGPITYKDLGEYLFRGDVWKFVMQIEGLQNYGQVFKKIDQRFNLGYTNGEVISGKVAVEWTQPEIIVRKPPVIQVSVRKFNKQELQYWNQYHQDISDLKREEIYVPNTIWRNRKKISITEMTFCYYLPEIGKWKLYRPLAKKRTKDTPPCEWKWDNSMSDLRYIEGLKSLEKCEIGIVEKSRKDLMVLKKALGINSICSVQAEDPSAMTDEDIEYINRNCKRKIICADNDKKGKEFSWWLTKTHQFTHANVPDRYLSVGITDFADMAREIGLDAVTRHFIDKKIVDI